MITISKEHKDAIKEVAKLPKATAAQEILRNVLLIAKGGTLTIKATDLTVELTRIIPVDIESEFKTTVNASKFMQAVNASTSDIKLIVSDKDIQIKSGRKRFTLPTISAEAYPAYPESDEMTPLNVNSFNFAQSVKSVLFAAGDGTVMPQILNGVCVNQFYFGAMSAKMAWLESGLDCNIVLPRGSVQYMPEREGGEVAHSDNILSIAFDDFVFKTVLLDGKYPDTAKLIPQHNKSISIQRNQFIDAIKSALITANEKSRNITIIFSGENSIVESKNSGEKSSSGFDCESSELFEVSCNAVYMIDALNALSSEIAKIEYEDDNKQIVVKDETFQSLVMPVKI